jgi:Outer membrane protein beta-barrel domain
MKNLLFMILLLSIQPSFAQNKKILSTANIGLVVTDINETGLSNSGFTTSTIIEYNTSKNLWLTGSLEFQMINYLKTTPKFTINDKINITPLKIGARYMLGDKTFFPYISTSVGLANLSSPTAELENTVIKIDYKNELLFCYDVGFGVQWKFKPTFFPFLEANFNQFFGKTDISEKNFNELTFRFGIRTYPF